MDRLVDTTVRRLCENPPQQQRENSSKNYESAAEVNNVVNIPYSFFDQTKIQISTSDDTSACASGSRSESKGGGGGSSSKLRRSSSSSSQGKAVTSHPDSSIPVARRKSKNKLYYSTPLQEEQFMDDLRDSFLKGSTRLKPMGLAENQEQLDVSISCFHSEDWINISKMGYFNCDTVQKIILNFLKEKCQFTGKSHLNIMESLRNLGLTDDQIHNEVVAILPSSPCFRYSGTLELVDSCHAEYFPRSYRNGREIIGRMVYGEFLHGRIGARRSFYRAALEKLDLLDFQISPKMESLPKLGELDFSEEQIDAKFGLGGAEVTIQFSCPLESDSYGKSEDLPMFSIAVINVEEASKTKKEEDFRKHEKEEVELIVALENSTHDFMKE